MSSSRLHIAIPDSMAMACDPSINLDSLHIGFIEGRYSEKTTGGELRKTRFGKVREVSRIEKRIKWGKKDLPYNQTVTLGEIFKEEGNFTITNLIAQWKYHATISTIEGPKEVTQIFLHPFNKWNFSPGTMKRIFNRIPSHPTLKMLLAKKKKWLKHTKDREAYKRMHATWLLNRPQQHIPAKILKLWYGKGALIFPETLGDFTGRELGMGEEFK